MTLTQRVTALEAELKKLKRMFESTPKPPPPAPPPSTPQPQAGPKLPFLALPKIKGSTDIGTGMLEREMAKAEPGWVAEQGRWYVQGSQTEMGSQATQPSGGVQAR